MSETNSPSPPPAGEPAPTPGSAPASPVGNPANRPRPTYIPAVGPRLRLLMWVLFAFIAVLGANSVYLVSVTIREWRTGLTYQNWFYQTMFLGHLALGLLLIAPFLVFAIAHMYNTRKRKNKRAIRVGYALFVTGLVVLVSGLVLVRLPGLEIKQPEARSVAYWAHVLSPLAALWLYWLHRLAGPRIKWKYGLGYLATVGVAVAALMGLHNQDPRQWHQAGPAEGAQYFFPSLARTATGNFIPAKTLMNDDYCLKCHKDAYQGWYHSAHHFSSFNNPMYLAAVRETREVSLKRDGHVKGARFCAGCHDPVPFFSGAFDDPKFDDVNHPTAQAGITCTVCHSITHVNSPRGNADFTIEEPEHYPFAFSDNPALQWVNNQLVKAKPAMHKKTFLKDFHKSAEFCSTCHKVHLPYALNHYKEFLRGQNHYDSYLLSGVSGHGARSFYYPPKAQQNCNECHMPPQPSADFGSKFYRLDMKKPSIHNHLFPSANTALAWLHDQPDIIQAHNDFNQGIMRVDLFGVKEGGQIDGVLHAPLRPTVPELKPGNSYLLETVVRTAKMGHHFTQGTVDSNEIWLDVTVTSGDRVIGRSGALDDQRGVDPYSHFLNVFMLDKDGNRIDRRNAQDIFIPLYNNQIPPGAGQTVHYRMDLPDNLTEPITVEVKLQYRKFDRTFMDFVTRTAKPGDLPIRNHVPGQTWKNELPIMTMAVDRVTFPVAGSTTTVDKQEIKTPVWERWNDYGIGLLLKGTAELRQAEYAFQQLEAVAPERYDGPLNLARVHFAEGDLDRATADAGRAAERKQPPAPPWTLAWLSGVVNRQQGRLADAEHDFRSVLEGKSKEQIERGFDFSLDYIVINLLGQTLYDQAKQIRDPADDPRRQELLEQAKNQFEKTLRIDPENVEAHWGLFQVYKELGQPENAQKHEQAHARYKVDDNARDLAQGVAKKKYPAAAFASEPIVIYPLNRATQSASREVAEPRD